MSACNGIANFVRLIGTSLKYKKDILPEGIKRDSSANLLTLCSDSDQDIATGKGDFMVMEPSNCSDLDGLLKSRGGGILSEEEAWPVLKQLVQALADIKLKSIVHRDIKPGNVLVFSHEISKRFLKDKAHGSYPQLDIKEYLQTCDLRAHRNHPYPFTFKVCDTGLAKHLEDGETTSTRTGTVGYLPPQVIYTEAYTHKGDVWGLGCTYF